MDDAGLQSHSCEDVSEGIWFTTVHQMWTDPAASLFPGLIGSSKDLGPVSQWPVMELVHELLPSDQAKNGSYITPVCRES